MQITSPVLRWFSLLVTLFAGARPLAAQGLVLPIQPVESQQADAADLPTTTERLSGIVVSSLDGAPIARAVVTSIDQRFAAFTDSQGRFSFDMRRAVPAGGAQTSPSFPGDSAAGAPSIFIGFNVRKPGFVSATLSFALPALQPDSPEAPLTLKLVPTGVIAGRIYSESGDPPESLVVQLLRKQVSNGRVAWLPANATTPDSRGEFRLANLDPGDYKLYIPAHPPDSDAPGTLATYFPSGTAEDSAAILTVAGGASIDADLRLRTAMFYDVTIPLAGTSGKGNLRSFLVDAPPGLSLQPNGQSLAGYLPEGSYELLLTSTEPATPSQPAPQISDALVKIEVHSQAVRTPPVALHPIPEIPIVIRKEFTSSQPQPPASSNQPSVYLFLQNLRQDLSQPAPSMKPNAGDEGLSLIGTLPGAYLVVVSGRFASSAYVASATSGTTDLLREPFQVLANSDPRPIEITLRDDFASVEANIAIDSTVPPLSPRFPINLFCIPLDRPQAMPGFGVSAQNPITVEHLAPGRYLLLAARDIELLASLEYTNEVVLRGLMQKGTVVTLAPNEKATVQVPLMPDGGN